MFKHTIEVFFCHIKVALTMGKEVTVILASVDGAVKVRELE